MEATKKTLHWTQRPENKARLARSLRRAWKARKAARHHKAAPGTHYGNPTGNRQHPTRPPRVNVSIPLPRLFVDGITVESKRQHITAAAMMARDLMELYGFAETE